MHQVAQEILEALNEFQDTKKAAWLENYVKHDIKALGVGIPNTRKVIRGKQEFILTYSLEVQQEILDDLMCDLYTESKLAAILFVQDHWADKNMVFKLKMIEKWFDEDWIYDWNVCDWLCVRLLSPMIDKMGKQFPYQYLKAWNKADNLWQARTSLVAFAACKDIKPHIPTILQFSKVLIKRPERFAKTSVGWLMRVLSKIQMVTVEKFLSNHQKYLTREVIQNALKYATTDKRKQFTSMIK